MSVGGKKLKGNSAFALILYQNTYSITTQLTHMTEYRSLTAEEVFFIFKEEHRLCSPFDIEADPSFELQPTSTIQEWRDARDLLPWHQLAKAYNTLFKIEVDLEMWRAVLEPDDKKTVNDVCELVSQYAKIEVIKPVRILGQTCLSSALFKSITRSLAARGVDTSGLSPSSRIEPYLKNNFHDFLGFINNNFTGVIPEIKERRTILRRVMEYSALICMLSIIGGIFWSKLLIITIVMAVPTIILWYLSNWQFKHTDDMLTIPGVVTFRDLINRILEVKYASR